MNLSRKLLIVEAVLIALPLTVLSFFGVASISLPGKQDFWPFGAADFVTLSAQLSVVAGWALLWTAIRDGGERLRSFRPWWLVASWGVVLVFAAIVSKLLPPSPEYSPAAVFREHLELCILGLPLVAVLTHVWAEARWRRSAGIKL
jgi:hypothetical protein